MKKYQLVLIIAFIFVVIYLAYQANTAYEMRSCVEDATKPLKDSQLHSQEIEDDIRLLKSQCYDIYF